MQTNLIPNNLSWVFKSFSDAAATADATSAHKIAILK